MQWSGDLVLEKMHGDTVTQGAEQQQKKKKRNKEAWKYWSETRRTAKDRDE